VPKPPAALPPSAAVASNTSTPQNPALLAQGQALYFTNCARCHAYGPSAGIFPALLPLSRYADSNFENIVHDGALSYAGMSAFSDLLDKSEVEAIHAFLRASHQLKPTAGAAPH
jgi:quinohemoprotein ethanol dehydrogenase